MGDKKNLTIISNTTPIISTFRHNISTYRQIP